ISIVERGHQGVIIPDALFYYRRYPGSNSRRWDDPEFVAQVTRMLVGRHERSYRENLFDVLMLKETRVGGYLKSNYDLQRQVERDLLPLAQRHREQLNAVSDRSSGSPR